MLLVHYTDILVFQLVESCFPEPEVFMATEEESDIVDWLLGMTQVIASLGKLNSAEY